MTSINASDRTRLWRIEANSARDSEKSAAPTLRLGSQPGVAPLFGAQAIAAELGCDANRVYQMVGALDLWVAKGLSPPPIITLPAIGLVSDRLFLRQWWEKMFKTVAESDAVPHSDGKKPLAIESLDLDALGIEAVGRNSRHPKLPPHCSSRLATHITGLPPLKLTRFAREKRIPGAEKHGRVWVFDMIKLQEWTKARKAVFVRDEIRRDITRSGHPTRKNSLGAAAAEYLLAFSGKDRSRDAIASSFRLHILPRWSSRRIDKIQPCEIVEAIKEIKNTKGKFAALRALDDLRRIYNWALANAFCDLKSSPCQNLKPRYLIGPVRATRTRILSDVELKHIWHVAEGNYPFGAIVRMLLLTGQRRNEVACMTWSEVDEKKKLWTIPGDRMKSGSTHLVPLSRAAMKLLAQLPRWQSGFVFSVSGDKPARSYDKMKNRFDIRVRAALQASVSLKGERSGSHKFEPWRIHDIRRTVRTHFSAVPVPDLVRGLVIDHSWHGLDRTYDQYTYMKEKRECLELWSKRLMAIVEPPKRKRAYA